MTEAQPAVIRLDGLHKTYARGRVLAVDGVSLSVPRGHVYGLIGPDGCGKTSILQVLAGVLSADAGHAEVAGIDVLRRPEAVKPLIGYMPQGLGLNLYDTLSVAENIAFFRALRQVPPTRFRDNAERLLAMTRLSPFLDRPAGKLSGGMRQKLALICTLIHLPDILLLDEPTTGVDPISRRDFWSIIHDLVATRDVTVLLTTSYMDEAERCTRVGLMNHGRLIAEGTPAQLCEALPGRLVSVSGAAPQTVLPRLAAWPQTLATALFGREVHALLDDGCIDVAARLQADGIGPVEVQDIPPGLEDVFVHRVAHGGAGVDAPPPVLSAGNADTTVAPVRTDTLTCRFGSFTAVDAVDLAVEPGEIFGLLGPNGAGKTTLIKMLCGLLRPSAGRAQVLGIDLSRGRDRRRLRARIGYMSQRFSLYRDLTVRANLDLYAGLYALPRGQRAERIDTLLGGLELSTYAQRVTRDLPSGLRQRVALAAALLHEPRLLFLDEPTSGVDPLARREFWDLVHLLARGSRITVLVSTHYMDEAEHCDRLGLMHQGRLIAVDAPDALRARAGREGGPVVAVDASDFAAAYQVLHEAFPDAMLYGRRIQWQTATPDTDTDRARTLLAGAQVDGDLRQLGLTMEEAFVHFVSRSEADHA
ncbi:ATP-binding cassette domain-containing protein [Immundisolibacter sp.]|uniref:ATP-binding cassette domain-containing protein n=1 Tax=Immundisolibacter sp. TaxID=1934948 RepID=UPI000EBA0133|nr:ABC transporter ATP-binding protein [Gammaproteobacteria bacterium]